MTALKKQDIFTFLSLTRKKIVRIQKSTFACWEISDESSLSRNPGDQKDVDLWT
jgi:hypothetical protein